MKKQTKYVVVILVLVMLGLMAVLGFQHFGNTRSGFEIDDVEITAQLETDGTLHVVDHRRITSDANARNIYWDIASTNNISTLKIEGVRIIKSDATITSLTSKRYDYNWTNNLSFNKQTDIGERGSFTFDDVNSTLYISLSDELLELNDAIVEVVYSINNSVYVYDDVAELYWNYYVSNSVSPTPNLNARLVLPIDDSSDAIVGSNIWGWGHGPEGSLDFMEGIYTFSSKKSSSRSGASAHVVMSKSWLGNVDKDGEMIAHGARRDYAISEEAKWTDDGSYYLINVLIMNIALMCISIVVLALTILSYKRKLAEYQKVLGEDESVQVAFDGCTRKLQRNYLAVGASLLLLSLITTLLFNCWLGMISVTACFVMIVIFTNWCPYVKNSWRDALQARQLTG